MPSDGVWITSHLLVLLAPHHFLILLFFPLLLYPNFRTQDFSELSLTMYSPANQNTLLPIPTLHIAES